MTSVNAHSMVHHGVLNLIDDGGSSSLNTQGLLNLKEYTEKGKEDGSNSIFNSGTHNNECVFFPYQRTMICLDTLKNEGLILQ